jgi:hypothetical protein
VKECSDIIVSCLVSVLTEVVVSYMSMSMDKWSGGEIVVL